MFCPLCANQGDLKYLEKGVAGTAVSYSIYQCPVCNLQFSNPMKAAGSAHYEIVEWYGDRWEFGETLRLLSDKKGKILEIGCLKRIFS